MSPLYPFKSFLLLLSLSYTHPTQSICYSSYLHVLRAPIRGSFPEKFDSPCLSSLWWSKALLQRWSLLRFPASSLAGQWLLSSCRSCLGSHVIQSSLKQLFSCVWKTPSCRSFMASGFHNLIIPLLWYSLILMCGVALQMCRLGLGTPCSLISYSLTSSGSLE